jgi:hypothetical protein
LNVKWGLTLLILFFVTGCSADDSEQVEYQTETSTDQEEDFTLEVSTPVEVKTGDTFVIEQKLTYNGTEELLIVHGDPAIRSKIINENGEEVDTGIYYVDHALITEFTQGKSINLEENFTLNESGNYEIHTSALFHKTDDLEGSNLISTFDMLIQPIKIHVSN